MQDPQAAGSASSSRLLSCTTCRQRKIKCNRLQPCNHCQKSGVTCQFPSPTRRTHTPKNRQHATQARDTELLRRIQRLESLVAKVNAVKAGQDSREEAPSLKDDFVDSAVSISSYENVSDHNVQRDVDEQYAWFVKQQCRGVRYLGSDFWTGLGDEFDGLRQLLELRVESDEDESEDDLSPPSEAKEGSPQFIFQNSNIVADLKDAYPSDAQHATLFDIYFANVDPICRILHKPVMRAHLSRRIQFIDGSTHRYKFGSLQALCFAIYFAAVTSLSSEECTAQLGVERDVLLEQYKRATETALAQADFLNSMEIVTLQAFTLYITVVRSHNKTRSSWALIGLAIRIAQGLGLHRDGDVRTSTIFEAEMRRRLWWQLVVLDVRASEDRGSEPVISEGSFNTRMPHNLNDEDFGKNSQHELSDKVGLTEMSFCMMGMLLSDAIRKLNFIPLSSEHHALTIEQKEQLVKHCTERIESHYLSGYDPSIPLMWLASMLGRVFIHKLWLIVQFPLQSRKSTPQKFPKSESLRTVVAYLTLSDLIEDSEAAAGLRWFFKTYVPWHALAVALAELCTQTQGPLVDQAWTVIDKCYSKWSDRVADTKEGMLWRPVKRLFKRAQSARHGSQLSTGSFPDIETRLLDPAWQDTDIVSGLPNLCLEGPTRSPFSSAKPSDLDSHMQPLDLSGYLPDVPVDLNILAPIDMSSMTAEELTGPINWDDWNAFISDVNTNGTDILSEMQFE